MPYTEAYLQIRNYMHAISAMFIYNAICVLSDLSESHAGPSLPAKIA